MKMLNNNKGIILTFLAFILLIFIYNSFFKDSASTLSEGSSTTIGDDLVKTYNELKAITFDQSLFSSNSYIFLNDFSAEIPQQVVGRPNPFNVIGRD